MWKKKKLPKYHPSNLPKGTIAHIVSGYETYVMMLKQLEEDDTKDVIESSFCEEGIDRWFIITRKRLPAATDSQSN